MGLNLLLWTGLCLSWFFSSATARVSQTNYATFLILGQQSHFDNLKSLGVKQSIIEQSERLEKSIQVFIPHLEFSDVVGFWTVWTLFSRIFSLGSSEWYIFLESDSHLNAEVLFDFLQNFDPEEKHFLGNGLYDEGPVIIHHFHGYDEPDNKKFLFPEFACGFALSRGLLANLTKVLASSKGPVASLFSIDAKHELALLIYEQTATELSSFPNFFCLDRKDGCAIFYEQVSCVPASSPFLEDITFAVKTFSGNHDVRLPIIKNTWGASLPSIKFFSDVADEDIPTINSGIPNTERGHCGKTFAILKYFVDTLDKNLTAPNASWLLLADDDTLLSIPRLLHLLACYSNNENVILGERYGYGFTYTGRNGYDYPTGGSGMVFSPLATRAIVSGCECPTDDSPDDMIIGVCARRSGVVILHSAAFHQARHIDYPKPYLRRVPPISFHKFDDIDPYHVYRDYLQESDAFIARGKQEL
ncbi:hypothetical protein RB195_014950 [Necator americanus]|uniref:N-acetylgalactosaminide beta-1,3-galactosyltransferase n=1 Tax=Necator americanus TaxID=51031 RepID=A0ABR1E2F7_NECAM